MKTTLKKCPFCGGEPAFPDVNNHTWCTNVSCGSEAYMHVEAWNTRQAQRDASLEPDEDQIASFVQEAYDQGFRDAKNSCCGKEVKINRHQDIILEAINEYDQWMLDDDYDAGFVLDRIMKNMRDRLGDENEA